MNLKDYLYHNQIKQKDFAKLVGITTRTLYRIIHGFGLKLETAIKIEKATGGKVSLKELI